MNAGEQGKRAFVDPVQGGFEVDPPELSLRDVDLRRPIEVAHEFVHAGTGAFEIGRAGQGPVKFRPSESIERQSREVGPITVPVACMPTPVAPRSNVTRPLIAP